MAEKTPDEQLASENRELKTTLEEVRNIVFGSLVSLDVAIKFGALVGVWFFPLPQDRVAQAIAMGSYAILVTLISKGLVKIRALKK